MAEQDKSTPERGAPDTASKSATTADQDAAWAAANGGTWETRRAEIAKEYGEYVATQDINIGGVLAFTRGHAVPVSHVEKYGLSGRNGADGQLLVVKTTSKDGKAVAESIAAAQRGE